MMNRPKGEEPLVLYCDTRNTPVALLTRRGETFYIYVATTEDGNWKRTGKGRSPPELEEKAGILRVIWK